MFRRHLTVQPDENVLAFRDGVLLGVFGPGRHRRRGRTRVVRVDTRRRLLVLAPQDVLTADGLGVRATLAVRWRVVDPVTFHAAATDAEAEMHLAAQIVLRSAVAAVDAENLAARPDAVGSAALTAALVPAATAVGVEVDEVVLRDVILPPAVRDARTELVTARTRGQARLEEARAETAALRALANGARLLEEHPALARVRLVEAAGPGTQLVLHVGDDARA
ncbi:SPFH domain-containing protein [Sanguibacter sp. HDW7]|uniref:SPFH domain-containing protein n=1 Tax=Sanguibacter sp. HDW7 TaxID=2714931 RepID=UPI00140ADD4B|nr:SPFH domain-containing protein [Sanguibacter sp. HDW7]QIK84772.1 slipin family protein [Sanguibacter sp. HDW7]